MSKQILDPEYWMQRERKAREEHHAIFVCPSAEWRKIADKHRKLLAECIQPDDSILDVGCGWGRLLSLMPLNWRGGYFGVDICPTFIQRAKREHPGRIFVCNEIKRVLPTLGFRTFDVAICISIRPMIVRELGQDVWDGYVTFLQLVAKRTLYLEYDVNAEAAWEWCM